MLKTRLPYLILLIVLFGLAASQAHALVCSGPCNGGAGCWTSADGNHPWSCTTPCPCGGGSTSTTTPTTPQETSGPVDTTPPAEDNGGTVDADFLENNFQPGLGVPPPEGPGVGYEVGGPVEPEPPLFTWPPEPSPEPPKGNAMGDKPGWNEFQGEAQEDWDRINRQIQAFEQFLEKNKESMETLQKLRDQIADKLLDQADKTWETYKEGALDELTGQVTGMLGDSSETLSTILEWQEYAEIGESLQEGGLESTLEDLLKAPVSLLYYVGDVLNELAEAQGLATDLEHLNEIMDDMYQAQQPMRDYLESLYEARDQLAESIQDTEHAFFESDNPDEALREWQEMHEKIGDMTGTVNLTEITTIPGRHSRIPGVRDQYWDHSATFTTMPPDP